MGNSQTGNIGNNLEALPTDPHGKTRCTDWRQVVSPFMGSLHENQVLGHVHDRWPDHRPRRGSALGGSDHLARSVAFGAKRWWYYSSLTVHRVLTKAHFDQLRVPRLAP
jgi:hypothetical protein